MKWQVTAKLYIFQGEMAHKEAPLALKLSQNIALYHQPDVW